MKWWVSFIIVLLVLGAVAGISYGLYVLLSGGNSGSQSQPSYTLIAEEKANLDSTTVQTIAFDVTTSTGIVGFSSPNTEAQYVSMFFVYNPTFKTVTSGGVHTGGELAHIVYPVGFVYQSAKPEKGSQKAQSRSFTTYVAANNEWEDAKTGFPPNVQSEWVPVRLFVNSDMILLFGRSGVNITVHEFNLVSSAWILVVSMLGSAYGSSFNMYDVNINPQTLDLYTIDGQFNLSTVARQTTGWAQTASVGQNLWSLLGDATLNYITSEFNESGSVLVVAAARDTGGGTVLEGSLFFVDVSTFQIFNRTVTPAITKGATVSVLPNLQKVAVGSASQVTVYQTDSNLQLVNTDPQPLTGDPALLATVATPVGPQVLIKYQNGDEFLLTGGTSSASSVLTMYKQA